MFNQPANSKPPMDLLISANSLPANISEFKIYKFLVRKKPTCDRGSVGMVVVFVLLSTGHHHELLVTGFTG